MQHRTPLTVDRVPSGGRKGLGVVRPRGHGPVRDERLRRRRGRGEPFVLDGLHRRRRPRVGLVLLLLPLLVRVLELLGHEASRHLEAFCVFGSCQGVAAVVVVVFVVDVVDDVLLC